MTTKEYICSLPTPLFCRAMSAMAKIDKLYRTLDPSGKTMVDWLNEEHGQEDFDALMGIFGIVVNGGEGGEK